ncbi:MAG: SMP-30/gluconolactonase/LRE family protein [Actinomycetia bacterium]|nr:SMP-30/gluconolactonase/LRE family protein [Actinomycetes bacterium]
MAVVAKSSRLTELVAPGVEVEQIATGFTFTEGPVWHPDGYLLFSDMPADIRRKWSEDGGIVEVMKPSNKCNGLTLDADLNLIVCEHWTSELVRASLNADGTEASREVIASRYEGTALNSPNDVVVKSDGSIYFSDPTYGRMDVFGNPRDQDLSFQGVYRIPPGGGDLELLADDYAQPNGLCFSPDESTLYVNDSERIHIRAYDVQADGSLTGERMVIENVGTGALEDGIPDGMKCDEQGNVWVTGPRGVWVVDPNGEHLGTVEIPEHVGNLNWGGPEWNVLYLPSSTSVYRFSTTTRGAPASYMR